MSSKTLNTRLLTRHDTYANWMTQDPVLYNGELAVVVIPADAGSGVNEPSILLKVGDGTKKFSKLGWLSGLAGDVYDWAKASTKPTYAVSEITGLSDALASAGTVASYYSVSTVEEMNAIESPNHGDVCIVKTSIGESDKYSYTAYVYDTNVWSAMDGNYSADNVYLSDDITMAGNYTAVGNLTKTSTGTATFATKGKTVMEALQEIFSKRLQPTKTNPSLTVTLSQAGAKEVGTTVTPSYTSSFNPGKYTYDSSTGVTATSYTVNGAEGSASGTLDSFVVEDNTNFTVSMTVTYSAGNVAKDNLGSDSDPAVQIAAGTVSKTSSAVTGYRSFFYGTSNDSSADVPVTSAVVRGLTNGGAPTANKVVTVNADSSTKRIIVAIPHASGRSVKEVILTSSMNLDITPTYVMTSDIEVEGANNYATTVPYDVYVYEPASVDAGEVHQITLG